MPVGTRTGLIPDLSVTVSLELSCTRGHLSLRPPELYGKWGFLGQGPASLRTRMDVRSPDRPTARVSGSGGAAGRSAVPSPRAAAGFPGARGEGSGGRSPRRVPGGRRAGRRADRAAVPAGDFVYQFKGLCYFTNGTQRVRLVTRYIYNRKEYARFDSDVGEYRAVNELGRPDAEYWNGNKDILERVRAEVDTVCRHNYPMDEAMTLHQRVEPTVTISPSKTEALNHHNMLVCSVTDFYPGQVKVRWFRNNQEETAGVVSTPLIRNGDWTFQILVMLEMTPQQGDVYTCHVEHPSRQSPITVEWRAQSESAQSKMLSGVGGFVLGLIFLGLGLFIRQRKQKGSHGPPSAGLLR